MKLYQIVWNIRIDQNIFSFGLVLFVIWNRAAAAHGASFALPEKHYRETYVAAVSAIILKPTNHNYNVTSK